MPIPMSCKASSVAALLLVVLTLGPPVLAQDDQVEEKYQAPRTVLKAFKYADVAEIKHLIELVEVEVAVDPKRKLMVIRGPEDRIDTAVRLVDALDTPEPHWGIDLYVHVVEASKDAASSSDIPADLEAAFADLTEHFGYRGYELVDTLFLHATRDTGGAKLSTSIGEHATITVRFDKIQVIYGEPKNLIRFENLDIESVEAGIDLNTNVEVGDGHKLLIGKSSRRGADVVLVIEARLKNAWPPGTGG